MLARIGEVSSRTLASRHPGSRRVVWPGLPRLAQLLRRTGVEPVPARLSPDAETPLAAGAAPAVPASPLRLEATGAHDRNSLAARLHPPPVAGPAVRRQAPEVGAGWSTVHVRILCGEGCAAMRIPTATAGGAGATRSPIEIPPDCQVTHNTLNTIRYPEGGLRSSLKIRRQPPLCLTQVAESGSFSRILANLFRIHVVMQKPNSRPSVSTTSPTAPHRRPRSRRST